MKRLGYNWGSSEGECGARVRCCLPAPFTPLLLLLRVQERARSSTPSLFHKHQAIWVTTPCGTATPRTTARPPASGERHDNATATDSWAYGAAAGNPALRFSSECLQLDKFSGACERRNGASRQGRRKWQPLPTMLKPHASQRAAEGLSMWYHT
eukprot:365644-Chlamydomonas_euryale.AAC.6